MGVNFNGRWSERRWNWDGPDPGPMDSENVSARIGLLGDFQTSSDANCTNGCAPDFMFLAQLAAPSPASKEAGVKSFIARRMW